MALTDLTRISTSGIATGTSLSGAILHGDAHFRGTQVGVNSAIFDSSDDALEFNDNVKLTFGNSGDLQVYHTGSNSIIRDQGTGTLSLQSNGTEIALYNYANSQYMGKFANAAQVELYHAGNLKITTDQAGAKVTGVLTATSFSGPIIGSPINNPSGISTFYDVRVINNLTVEGTTTTLDTNLIGVDRVEVGANSNSVVGVAITQSGTADIVNLFDGATQVVTVDDVGNVGLGSAIPSAKLDVRGVIKIPDATNVSGATNHIAVGDNSDLKLYHDNNGDAYVTNDTGHLTIRNNTSGKIINLQPKSGANGIIARYEGSAELYHNGTEKFKTIAGGVEVTGGHLIQQYGGISSKIGYISGGAEAYYGTTTNHALFIGTAGSNRIKISNSSAATSIGGSMVFNAMLTVQGDVSGAIFQLKAAENTNRLMVAGSDSNGVEINLYDDTGGQRGILGVSGTEFFIKAPNNSAPMTFYTHNGSGIGERLRINSNGDVTTTGQASFNRQNAGFTARAGDSVSITRASGTPLELNRTGSDGQMIALIDDNSIEASIGLSSGSLVIGLPNSSTERLRIGSSGGVGISTDKIRNSDFLHIATASQDFTNPTEELMDGGGICFQNTDTLATTGKTMPGIFWASNTNELGRARAGIIGVAANNHDATDIVFLAKYLPGGEGIYPRNERMRIQAQSGNVLIGHNSSPTSDSDKLQVISTSSGTGICLHNYSASNYGNQIAFMKSRNSTIGSNTILQSGDRIGELNFYGNDGSGRSLGAQISVRVSGTPGNDNTPAAMYFMNGTNQSMQTRLSILPAGTVGISKNGWASSDNSFALTVHTGSTSDSGNPVNDGIMIVSQNSNGNQNSTTGKLMFCGHAQTNGPFLYGDNEQAYGKKGLVFHTLSTANSYSTQLEETARFTFGGRFGLGTGTAVDSLMHIQGNSDNGDTACQLTIEDEDTTAGSKIPSIQFKGNGVNTGRIRGTDTGGITFSTWNGSSDIQRSVIGNHAEGGAFLLNADDRGWATFRHNNNQGLRTHIRRHYSPGNAVQTYTILRIRRHWWGWGSYKIRCKALYYNSSLESTYFVNGHGSGGNNYSIANETYGGDASSNSWNCTVTHTASNNSPGSSSTWYADVKVNIPNYYYAIIYIEAYSSQYSTDPNNMSADSYCLM